eukprot:618252-Prorocentrum_minimum.AAC.1
MPLRLQVRSQKHTHTGFATAGRGRRPRRQMRTREEIRAMRECTSQPNAGVKSSTLTSALLGYWLILEIREAIEGTCDELGKAGGTLVPEIMNAVRCLPRRCRCPLSLSTGY